MKLLSKMVKHKKGNNERGLVIRGGNDDTDGI